ncbi:MAG TPA: hypothetical protein VIC85_18020 [Ktedonobacterales bacterium]
MGSPETDGPPDTEGTPGGAPNSAPKLWEDKLVQSVKDHLAALPDTVAYVGYLGEGTEEGRYRLYLTPGLDEYLEFQEGDAETAVPLAAAENPLAGSLVWIKRDARVRHVRIESRTAEEEFVRGDIASAYPRQTFAPWAAGAPKPSPYAFTPRNCQPDGVTPWLNPAAVCTPILKCG